MTRLFIYVFTFSLLFFSFTHKAYAVKGQVTVKVNMFKPAAKSICKGRALRRQSEALVDLWKNSKKICPSGFKVNWGPVCNSYIGTFAEKKRMTWSYFCTNSCFADIDCTEDEQYPIFDPEKVNEDVPEYLNWVINYGFSPRSNLVIIRAR